MIPISTSQTLRTSRHIRTMRSIPTNTGSAQDRWPRLQQTEQIKHAYRRLKKERFFSRAATTARRK